MFLVCTRLSCFGDRSIQWLLDCDKLCDPTYLPMFCNASAKNLELLPPISINEQWSLIRDALHSTGFVSCDLIRLVVIPLVSVQSIPIPTSQFIPTYREHKKAHLNANHERKTNLQKNLEIWWSHHTSEIKHAATTGSSRKLFHFIRAIGKKALNLRNNI